MNICVIGGSGHIGKNLVEMLLADGWEVTIVVSGNTPIPQQGKWDKVTVVRSVYKHGDTKWSDCLRSLAPEMLVDILEFDLPATYEAVKSTCKHIIACGSVWMLGRPRVVPTPEETQNPCEFEGYARRYKELLEVKNSAAQDGIAFTAILPPNICGPDKVPLDGMGKRDIKAHQAHARGEQVPLPAPGQTLIGPCDAEDVAQGFFLSIQQPDKAADQIFNVGAAYALTIHQFIEVYAQIYGVQIPVEWCSSERFAQEICPDLGARYHFEVNMCPDITKIRTLLGYSPKYSPEETMNRAVAWMKEQQML